MILIGYPSGISLGISLEIFRLSHFRGVPGVLKNFRGDSRGLRSITGCLKGFYVIVGCFRAVAGIFKGLRGRYQLVPDDIRGVPRVCKGHQDWIKVSVVLIGVQVVMGCFSTFTVMFQTMLGVFRGFMCAPAFQGRYIDSEAF